MYQTRNLTSVTDCVFALGAAQGAAAPDQSFSHNFDAMDQTDFDAGFETLGAS
jgi:hypothetical protein